ncbi:MAG: hypothetical protein DMG42_15725 [Acidobacteria bacterium]|nr:MAG: hypothetical protein DMG42_15725 [Acidobacteriota bacterium]
MTWIQTVRMEDDGCVKNAIESQRKLYPTEYATPVQPVNNGETAGIVASHTLHQHEMIATMVSVTNRCHY